MKQNYLITAAVLLAATCGNAIAQEAKTNRLKAASQTTLEKPVMLPATGISKSGFTMNWQPVADADGYGAYVYTKAIAPEDGKYAIVSEDFNLIIMGSVIEPVWSEDMYIDLDQYTSIPNWTVNGYASFAGGMVGGLVYSPYLDLRNNGGKYSITVTYYANPGDEIRVYTFNPDNSTVYKSHICENIGDNTFTLDFENGHKASFFYIVSMAEDATAPAYVDDVEVSQTLKKGDEVYTNIALNEALETTSWKLNANDLRFAGDATQLYYDVQAVKIDVSGDKPVYYYSPFSDMQEVNLANAGVDEIESTAKVYASDGAITISTEGKSQVTIHDFMGRLVAETTVDGTTSIPASQGIYLVTINGTTIKLAVK